MTVSHVALSALMFTAGVFIPAMAALNAGLGSKIGSAPAAVFILCLVATITSAFSLPFSVRPSVMSLGAVPPIYYLAGLLFVLYIGSITYAAPRIGLGNALLLVLFGQLVSTAIIYHFALFGATMSQFTFKRSSGVVLIAVGIYLARSSSL